MEKDTPRKQTVEEIQRQYEARLREATRQRAVLEAEFETCSERWRTERRRLNAEVDRLEAALSESRGIGSKPTGTKPDRGVDPLEVARIQAEADERIRSATKVWEEERDKLLKEVSRLERAVGELLERSNNPIRSSIPIRDDLESKLNQSVRAREKVEAVYFREKTSWDEEKLRMTAELIKLRHLLTQGKSPKGKFPTDERAKELELRIGSMQKEMDREREDWRMQIQQMERRLSETRQSVNNDVVDQLRRQYNDRIQEMILQKTQLTDELKRASALLETERGRFVAAAGSDNNPGSKDAINAEIARVQQQILEIGKRIDDPSTDLSTVIRKNVERAELSAYLRGIRYQSGNGKSS